MELATIDVLNSQTWTPEFFDQLQWFRENEPIVWLPANELWLITKYDDVAYISKNNDLFCSGKGVRPGSPIALSFIDMDPPRHTQLRKVLARGFTPRMVKKLEEIFRELTRETIDSVIERGACDFVREVAAPMPIRLIARMIGIDEKDEKDFHRWSDDLIGAEGNYEDTQVMARAAQAFVEYSNYIRERLEERRKNPKDDLLSLIVGWKDEGVLGAAETSPDRAVLEKYGTEAVAELANDELTMMLVLLLIAGNETTRNAISGGISALIENPLERDKLIDDPGLIDSAVEEIVRWVSPVLSMSRTATQNTSVRGIPIQEGQRVFMVYPSANRDADQFKEPNRFKVDRNPNYHLGFGIGAHFCLGANLARMEIRVTVEEVLRRMKNLQYTQGPPKMAPSSLVRSFVSMPVRFDPGTLSDS